MVRSGTADGGGKPPKMTDETPADSHQVEILEEREHYRFRQLFWVQESRLRFRHFDGSWSPEVTRVTFCQKVAVAVLLVDAEADTVVLVRQLRFPVLERQRHRGQPDGGAWLLEVPAGLQEAGESLEEVARREILEETGYRVEQGLEEVMVFYPSPGVSSEEVHLFRAVVSPDQRVEDGGGVADEHEDLEVVILPVERAFELLRRGEIRDGKTILALQHLALERLDGARSMTESRASKETGASEKTGVREDMSRVRRDES
ncbi:MAG: NUDIX hydrolase [Acidobacteriota bacterium]|nr:NUDIX hydrolase [Acidobacteriota bacterium]